MSALVEEIAIYLAGRLRPLADAPDAVRISGKVYLWHGATSTMENACNALWHLGVADAALIVSEGGLSPARYRVFIEKMAANPGFPAYFHIPDNDGVRRRLAASERAEWPAETTLLQAFIDYATAYEDDPLPSARHDAFVPPPKFESAIAALVASGYARPEGGGVRWTEKIAPVMEDLFLWE